LEERKSKPFPEAYDLIEWQINDALDLPELPKRHKQAKKNKRNKGNKYLSEDSQDFHS
jgi:hypothetical protein